MDQAGSSSVPNAVVQYYADALLLLDDCRLLRSDDLFIIYKRHHGVQHTPQLLELRS